MFVDESLGTFYKMNFDLMTEHQGFDLQTIEKMIPWERDVFISMLLAKIQKKKQELNNG